MRYFLYLIPLYKMEEIVPHYTTKKLFEMQDMKNLSLSMLMKMVI